jgi:PAS domain S-box-containing protein
VDLQALIERNADPAFASDHKGRVGAWNAAAERFLGCPAESVLGRACHAVIAAKDLSGNLHCQEDCSLRKMIRSNEPIHSFGMQVRRASGEFAAVRCSVFVLCDTQPCREYSLLHVLQPVHELNQAAFLEQARCSGGDHCPNGPDAQPESPGDLRQLTAREIDVLRLLADGHATSQVAEALHVSAHTVRTHIQHVLSKLDAHSQLQAVTFARQRNLI